MNISDENKRLIDNCLQNFLILSSNDHNTYIFHLLDSLTRKEGIALEYSGVYLESDGDNTPEDLADRKGITFSFMDQAVSMDMKEGLKLIIIWCKKNVTIERDRLLEVCAKIESTYDIATDS